MTHFPLPPWRFFPERRAGDRLLPLREPGPLGRENKRPLLAQDPEPGALVSPPPHLAPNIAAKGSTRGGERSRDLVWLALTHQTARLRARGSSAP